MSTRSSSNSQKYGPIMSMRFGFVPNIVASSPHAAEQFLKIHDLVFASRPNNRAAQFIAYDQRNLTFGKYGPYWRNMRKLCTLELLSTLKMNSFQAMRKQEVANFVAFINRAASSELLELILGVVRRMKELARIFDEFLERVINEHIQDSKEEKQNKDIVDTLMNIMQSGEAEFEFDRRHVKAILLDLLIASMDTSAAAIDWIF
ncbi:hypothetical protein HAX54_041532 [Datura stramonium]|uniref:Cytochrome P450 n=1 Tax=Datura stramonium TaxID=4076 RepID=A0ABS8RH08_DATST|nr:hypothetical protein [Datura stramonium]